MYYVWLSPRTKICEDWTDRSTTTATNDKQSTAQKKEVAVDNLEVGDHVEIQFVRRDESNANNIHQTEQMTKKHGRHRTFVGQATSVTILAGKDMHSANASPNEPKTNRGNQ